ncbi:MAG TPA: YraN family protein [Clostridiaceae bacterium]|nr:YraN family protein [Clostridiaceae bacterium]
MNNRAYGTLGEEAAAAYLIKQGYRILRRNFRAGRLGEIDIIGMDNDTLCFVEVKTRSSDVYGTPAQALSYRKQAAIIRLARIYMQNSRCMDKPVRFDVIELKMDRAGNVRDIHLIKNAFQE